MTSPATPLPPARIGSRDLFPDLAPRSYLNHAGVSPPSLAVRRAVEAMVASYARGGAAAGAEALAMRARLRARVAQLLGGRPDEVALTSGVSHGILAIALSYPWRSGDRVVLLEGEFPANVTPWQRAAALFGVEPLFLATADFGGDGSRGLEALDAALSRGARLVAVSAVQFQTGLAMPLREMAAICRRRGAEICVDAIQAGGVVPLGVERDGLDYVAGGGHKWLLGLEGAGYLWIRQDRLGALRPALAGWLSHEDPVAFLTEGRPGLLRYDRPLRRRADVFEPGSAATVSQAALDASLGTLLDLGVGAIQAHVAAYHDRLEPELRRRGFAVLREQDAARRSGILSARPPAGKDTRSIRRALGDAGVVVGIPDGLVRFAPHWPNSLDEVDVVASALDAALAA